MTYKCDHCGYRLDPDHMGKIAEFKIDYLRKGKRIQRTMFEVTCNECFADPEYQRIIKRDNAKVRDYPTENET